MNLKQWIADPYSTLEKILLPNGMMVYAIVAPFDWVRCRFMFKSGSHFDGNKLGLSHFTEHLISEQKNQLLWNVRKTLPEIGMDQVSASTSYSYNMYGFHSMNNFPKQQTNQFAISTAKDVLEYFLESLFETPIVEGRDKHHEIITREFFDSFPKGMVGYEERKRLQNLNNEPIPWLMFINPLGTPASIAEITLQDIDAFKQKYYTTENCTVLLICNAKTLKEYTETLSKVTASGTDKSVILPAKIFPHYNKKWNHVDMKFGTSENISINQSGYFTVDKKTYASASIICSLVYEKLFKILRDEKKLLYKMNIQNTLDELKHEFFIQCTSNVQQMDSVKEVFNAFFDTTLDNESFLKHKQRLTMIYSGTNEIPNDKNVMSNMIQSMHKSGTIITYLDFLKLLQDVTYKDAEKFLNTFITNSQRLTMSSS